jgi:hypothetical protein
MSYEQKNPDQSVQTQAFPQERESFKLLLLSNPNYFGNLAGSKLEPVLPISGNTHYEELGCVGYHPQQERLEAVVYLYQPGGYGTGLCGAGTPEYVRFYLSYDGGATWEDQGLASFQAHDIPGTDSKRRLEYAVSLAVQPRRKLCRFENLLRVRAILSWNHLPPANQPDWPPVWGNVREATIQVEPRRVPNLGELVEVPLVFGLEEIVDLDTPIPTKQKILGIEELAALYKDQNVPVHRFAYKELTAFATGKTAVSPESFAKLLPGIEIDSTISKLLFPVTDGNTSYEELKCIGLDPNSPNTLVGVIQVKESAGYSGGPCTHGSQEFVTFWGDFDGNGSFETWLGTAQVQVYDLGTVPRDGVYYAVRLPVDLDPYRQSCKSPKVVRIRAILSWSSPIPAANPNQVPTWGNREETSINIAPGLGVSGGKIAILGGIPVSMIDGSGFTTGDAVFATNNLAADSDHRPCPFGGRVTVQGAPVPGHSYRVEVIPAGGGAPTPVVTQLLLTRWDGTTYVHQANPVTQRFDYVDFAQNINAVLAQWDTSGDDSWTVKLTVFDVIGNPVGADMHVIQLDNTGPKVSVEITSGTGDCGKFQVGDGIVGRFSATDGYLRIYNLVLLPGGVPPGVLIPASGILNTSPAPGDVWTLQTAGMRPCGYVIVVAAWDRSIVDSVYNGHFAEASAGFCLEAPK